MVHSLDANKDHFLILASDGVWDVLSSAEAAEFVARDTGDKATVATRLVEYCLQQEAAAARLSIQALKRIPPGDRRGYHDDMTAVVAFLPASGSLEVSSSASGDSGGIWGSLKTIVGF